MHCTNSACLHCTSHAHACTAPILCTHALYWPCTHMHCTNAAHACAASTPCTHALQRPCTSEGRRGSCGSPLTLAVPARVAGGTGALAAAHVEAPAVPAAHAAGVPGHLWAQQRGGVAVLGCGMAGAMQGPGGVGWGLTTEPATVVPGLEASGEASGAEGAPGPLLVGQNGGPRRLPVAPATAGSWSGCPAHTAKPRPSPGNAPPTFPTPAHFQRKAPPTSPSPTHRQNEATPPPLTTRPHRLAHLPDTPVGTPRPPQPRPLRPCPRPLASPRPFPLRPRPRRPLPRGVGAGEGLAGAMAAGAEVPPTAQPPRRGPHQLRESACHPSPRTPVCVPPQPLMPTWV